jgi:hypothetical protein
MSLGLFQAPAMVFPSHISSFQFKKVRKLPLLVGISIENQLDVFGGTGLGKGNRFLNDLCDADVLVHIVDASGKTDERGNANDLGGHDVVHDVSWIHAELQRWILDNLRAKWSGVVRKPVCAPKTLAVPLEKVWKLNYPCLFFAISMES